MKNFSTLFAFVALALSTQVLAEPTTRMGLAANVDVSTGNKRSELEERRLGYAANVNVKTGNEKRLARSSAHSHSRRASHKTLTSKVKRDLNSPLDSRAVSLTLHRAPQSHEARSLHPLMYYQQHVNRAHRRHAHFLGRSVSDEDLVHNLRKRAESLGMELDETRLTKRGAPLERQVLETAKTGNGATGAASSGAGAANGAAAGFPQASVDALTGNTITAANKPTAANSLGMDIEANDVGYFATLQLGTPPQNFKILMDSGSADFWVSGDACKNSDTGAATCAHATLGAASSSFKASTSPFQVTYGTGNVKGVLIQDNLNLDGLQLNGHTFGATSTESNDFAAQTVPFDGLMGLAQSTLSNEGVLTPIEALAKAGTVASAQMGFTLGRASDGTNNNNGQVTFGGVDQTKFQGSLTLFANVNTQGFWEGAMDDVTVDGKSVNLAGRTGILDTGTTLIVAPPADAAAVHAAIPGAKSDGQGGFTVPCTSTSQVALKFGGQAFAINPVDLAFQPTSNNLQGDCVSGITAGQIGGAQEWLVGDVFLKNVYFATDVGKNQIGLAAVAPVQGGPASAAAAAGGAAAGGAGGAAAAGGGAAASGGAAKGGAKGKGAAAAVSAAA